MDWFFSLWNICGTAVPRLKLSQGKIYTTALILTVIEWDCSPLPSLSPLLHFSLFTVPLKMSPLLPEMVRRTLLLKSWGCTAALASALEGVVGGGGFQETTAPCDVAPPPAYLHTSTGLSQDPYTERANLIATYGTVAMFTVYCVVTFLIVSL